MFAWRIRPDDRLRWSDALLALALFAAIVRAFVPAGFMPEVRDGHVTLVICTADGSQRVDGTPRQATHGDDAMGAAHMPCAAAGLAALAGPPDLPLLSLPAVIEAGLVARDETPLGAVEPPYRPQSQRAPPHLPA